MPASAAKPRRHCSSTHPNFFSSSLRSAGFTGLNRPVDSITRARLSSMSVVIVTVRGLLLEITAMPARGSSAARRCPGPAYAQGQNKDGSGRPFKHQSSIPLRGDTPYW